MEKVIYKNKNQPDSTPFFIYAPDTGRRLHEETSIVPQTKRPASLQ